ncbi:hypothetical protein DYB25_005097 [Aphanomyces astaci]|uniref:ATP-dependent RNA helicase SUV3 DEXQ-box helicase domain-containing protein n=1 Tax=Aphanomyces astaci TaxID=112090 RepID=A0A397BJA6_APHAT|nr:hypothetical protein DYB25_005097 [Aphanomyces astaci]RHZ04615.1 hypothetical protein DYB31_000917 [Aphanomyces astaci]RHZ07733.1 hypothetical protein DYB26_012292 [Aphanomyces astaci]
MLRQATLRAIKRSTPLVHGMSKQAVPSIIATSTQCIIGRPAHVPLMSMMMTHQQQQSCEGWLAADKKILERRLKTFGRDFEIKSMAVAAGLNDQEWGPATTQFRRSLVSHPERHFKDTREMHDFVEGLKTNAAAGALQFYPLFLTFVKENAYIADISQDTQSLRELTDLRLPHTWYPKAHAMKRKIIYHGGPTNSGKTYEALLRLKQANDGLYCGPLRLLALEIYENLNMDGVYCSLITGEEKREIPSATHVACTVEMCNSSAVYDVAVLDEIQLMGDSERGWAWTRYRDQLK